MRRFPLFILLIFFIVSTQAVAQRVPLPQHLHDVGRETASRWIDEHFDSIGKNSTVDLRAMFQGTEYRG